MWKPEKTRDLPRINADESGSGRDCQNRRKWKGKIYHGGTETRRRRGHWGKQNLTIRTYPFIGILLTQCHPERSRRGCDAQSKDPESASFAMQRQGVLPMACPRNRISRPKFSARSCQRGFIFSMSAIFFSRRQPLSCFSRRIAFRT
jgi:hypothetical protein